MKFFSLDTLSDWLLEAKSTGTAPGIVGKINDTPPEIPEDATADELKLVWTISTSGVDRSRDIVEPGGWMFDNWIKGGSILWAHDPNVLPVAKPDGAAPVWVEGNTVKSTAVYTPRDVNPFGFTVYQLAKGGFIRGSSVGFKPEEWVELKSGGIHFKRQELLEWSHTPIPDQPEALLDAQSKGIDVSPLALWAEQVLDENRSIPGVTRGAIEKSYTIIGANPVTVEIKNAETDEVVDKEGTEGADTTVGAECKDVVADTVDDTSVAADSTVDGDNVEVDDTSEAKAAEEDTEVAEVETKEEDGDSESEGNPDDMLVTLFNEVERLSSRVAALENKLQDAASGETDAKEAPREDTVNKSVETVGDESGDTTDSANEVKASNTEETEDTESVSEDEIRALVRDTVNQLVAENASKL